MTKSKNKKEAREHGSGSIFKRPDGSYRGYTWLRVNGKNERKFVSGKDEQEVVEKIAEIERNLPFIMKNDSATFGQQMKHWLLVSKQYSIASRTFEKSIGAFNNHIEPYIGGYKTHELTTLTIQEEVINRMFRAGLNIETIKPVKHLLSQFFEFAIDEKMCPFSPMHRIKMRRKNLAEYGITEDEFEQYKAIPVELREKFLTCINDHWLLKPACLTGIYVSCRPQELLGLQWKVVDFENEDIDINRAITRKVEFDNDGKKISSKTILSDTKTAGSVRKNPMAKVVVHALKEHLEYMKALEKVTGIDYTSPDKFIFCTLDGRMRTYSGLASMFKKFLMKHDMYKKGFFLHGLRHTFATMLFEEKENPKVIQMLMGQKQMSTTMRYNNVNKKSVTSAMSILNSNSQFLLKKDRVLGAEEEPKKLEDASLEDLYAMIGKILEQNKKAK